MTGQLRRLPAVLLAAGLAACGPPPSAAPAPPEGIHFLVSEHDLGEIDADPVRFLSYPFEVLGKEVTLTRFEGSCGCTEPFLYVDDTEVALPAVLAPGTRGEVRVGFNTMGFKGRKNAAVHLYGTGPGLPAAVQILSFIRPFFHFDPDPVPFGKLDGTRPVERAVTVRAAEPFVLEKSLYVAPPLTLTGLPSAAPAREQSFTLVVPPEADQGAHRDLIRLQARLPSQDRPRTDLVLWAEYQMDKDIWITPGRHIPLGQIRRGIEAQFDAEAGARTGVLEPPECTLEGIPGATVRCVPFPKDPNRYRVHITLPGSLPPGPVSGRLHITLTHRIDGRVDRIEAERTLTAVVYDPASSRTGGS